MIITTQDLKAYTICPMLCKYNTTQSIDPLLKALKRALSYLYAFEMSNKKKVLEGTMISKWDRIWEEEASHIDPKELSEQAVDGWLTIKKFVDRVYNEDKRIPRIVNLLHKESIGSFHLQTTFDVVLQEKRGKVTLLEFSMVRDGNNMRWQLETDIEAKAKLYLLKRSLGRSSCELTRYTLGKNLHKSSIRATPEFMKDTEEIILGIVRNIRGELFYPSPTCKCPHPKKCRS